MEVVAWCVLTGAGAGRGALETPDVGFVGPSVEVLERLEMEGPVVVSCCRDWGFVGEVPEVGPAFLLGALPVLGVVLGPVVLEKAG